MKGIYLLKAGGSTIGDEEGMDRLAAEVAGIAGPGTGAVIVHGGGPAISAEMERRGMVPRKVGGVRVTDAAVLEVAEEVLRDINDRLVERLAAASVRAMGCAAYVFTVCTRKAACTVVEEGVEITADLGLVGEVDTVDREALHRLLDAGIVPVIYPIGRDERGGKLNINADTMAAGIAAGIGCSEMIAITDVPGVLMDVGDPSSKLDRLTLAEVDGLIVSGVISGGMLPKVEACRNALEAGVEAVRMVDGRSGKGMMADVLKGEPIGTVIVR